jgi:hypothetical protein
MAQQGLFEKLCMLKAYIHGFSLTKNTGITGVWIIIENTVVICNPWNGTGVSSIEYSPW